jgi:hypothetical protein
MRRTITIAICLLLSVTTALWIRRELGIPMNYAGDGGPDLLRLFLVLGLAAICLISGLIGSILVWRLVFLRPDSPARVAGDRDDRDD